MDREYKINTNRKKLPRFIALLLSLAMLAERASGLPGPVRRLVLFFLRRGEIVAHSYVYWELRDNGVLLSWAPPSYMREHSDPDAAMMLACWFRTLAFALRDLPRQALIVQGTQAEQRLALTRFQQPIELAAEARQAPDTS